MILPNQKFVTLRWARIIEKGYCCQTNMSIWLVEGITFGYWQIVIMHPLCFGMCSNKLVDTSVGTTPFLLMYWLKYLVLICQHFLIWLRSYLQFLSVFGLIYRSHSHRGRRLWLTKCSAFLGQTTKRFQKKKIHKN